MSVATGLGQHWHDGDHMDGGWWWVMGIGWLVVLALLVVVVVVMVRHLGGSGPGSGGDARRQAEDVLAERFARGEIDADEFRQRRDALRE